MNQEGLNEILPARIGETGRLNASLLPLTWFSVVGMMSGVCGSIVAGVVACLASSSNQSGLPARVAGDIIEIGDGRPRKENTLTVHTVRSITSRTPTVLLSHSLRLSPFRRPFSQASVGVSATVPIPNLLAALAETRACYTDAWNNVRVAAAIVDPEKSSPWSPVT